jgi:predicted Zn-ribbon and HTH transcriptional regulator
MTRRARKEVPGAMRLYPSGYARTRKYPHMLEGKESRGKGEDAETRCVRCAQCGAPIEDKSAVSECWNCSSDNIEGRRL